MNRAQYLDESNWLGSFYEVSLELGPTGDDSLAHRALTRLWRNPALHGPWTQRCGFMEEPDELRISADQVPMYGVLRLNEDVSLGCMSHLMRIEGECDWLDLSIPTAMLEASFDVSYPLDMATNPWMSTLDECLAEIVGDIFKVAPFRLALLGEEASGACTSAELTRHIRRPVRTGPRRHAPSCELPVARRHRRGRQHRLPLPPLPPLRCV